MELYAMHKQLATLVDELIAEEDMLTKISAEVKKPAFKEILSQSAKSLYKLRETLVPVEMKSMFADIRRLREDISEVYVAVCSNESKPSNLQEMRTKDLNDEIKKATEALNLLKDKYVPVLNKIGPKP
jgi:predicted  nucleic acid-binding Zn-ribbon protein